MEIKGIKGFIQNSLSDWDGKVCSIIFLSGCNFRCPFCFNEELVNNEGKDIDFEEIRRKIISSRMIVDCICITGGEPTLNPRLIELISELRGLNLRIKLDTNGSNPELLSIIISRNLIDYIAMDIKTSLENYEMAAGVCLDISRISESAKLIMNSGIDYEFRTTVSRNFFDEATLKSICKWLNGGRKYVLQQMDYRRKMLSGMKMPGEEYGKEDLEEFARLAGAHFKIVDVRSLN